MVTLNVNGMRVKRKRAIVNNLLRNDTVDIFLLQETHLTEKELKNELQKENLIKKYNIFCASCNDKNRCGVATLIKKAIPFQFKLKKTDPEGRYVIVEGASLTLANIYGPNKHDPKFFIDVFLNLNKTKNIIMAGDFNTVSPMDSSVPRHRQKKTKELKNYMEEYGLFDSWRMRNPNVKEYTHKSARWKTFSRIDFFLVSDSLMQHITGNEIHGVNISDHAPVSLTIQFPIEYNAWETFLATNTAREISSSTFWENGKKAIENAINLCAESMDKKPNICNSEKVKKHRIFFRRLQDLYQNKFSPNPEIDDFFDNIQLPTLSKKHVKHLNNPFTEEEIRNSLDDLLTKQQHGFLSQCGPDGLSLEFYGENWKIFAPHFYKFVKEIEETWQIKETMNRSKIEVILEQNKDPTDISSYLPHFHMNIDLKIIANALAKRLELVTPNILISNKIDFMCASDKEKKKKQTFLKKKFSQTETRTILYSFDVEHAFEKVNWYFLFYTLQKFGFDENAPFFKWIKALYTSPTAVLSLDGITSQSFPLQQGIRRGCPLSKYLFAIFIEPLVAAIQQNEQIKGITYKREEYKISLHLDKILLNLQNPKDSKKEVIKTIQQFKNISNFPINLENI